MTPLTKTTMIRAVFVALFLVSTLATASAESVVCEDDADYRWKNREKASCDWIGTRQDKKFEKICSKKKPQMNCPVTCGSCEPDIVIPDDDYLSKNCPLERPSFSSPCSSPDDYPRYGCGYNYIVQGCTREALSCGPIAIAQCEETYSYIPLPISVPDSGGEDIRTKAPRPYAWQVVMFAMEACQDVPSYWPAGGSCDPDTFDADSFFIIYEDD